MSGSLRLATVTERTPDRSITMKGTAEKLCRRKGGSTEALVPDESKRLRKNIIRK